MTDYALAEAFVQIRPDTTGFRAETEAKIKAALSGIKAEVKVKITPDVSGFAATVKTALASALGGKAGKIPIKLDVESDLGAIDAQIRLIKQRMAQTGLSDFLDYSLPIGKVQYQIQLLRRLLQQGHLTDFIGTSLAPGQILEQAAALRTALQRELTGVNVGVGLNAADLSAEAVAARAALQAALGGVTVHVAETMTGGAGAPVVAGGGNLTDQAAAATADANALLKLAAASRNAGDAAKYAYAANIANNIAMAEAAKVVAPVADAANRAAGRWGFLTNKVTLFGGAFRAAGIPLLGAVGIWHILTDAVIETIAVLIPATVAFIAFGAAAAPTAQHIYVQMTNIWTASNALNKSIYPLTNSMKSLGDAVKPEVYQLFGQALVVMNAKAGEFSKIAADAGKALDVLGARAAAALVSGGVGQFLSRGPQDLAKIGDVIGNIFGIVGNLLKTMPGYAEKLLGVLDAVTHGIENVTGSGLVQWLISAGLWFHGAILYGGLAATAFILVGNALVGLAAKFGLASSSATFFDAALFGNGLRQAIGGIGLLAGEMITFGASEDIAAAGALTLEGAMTALTALLPVLAITAAAAAIAGLVYWLTRANQATADYDAGVKAALSNAPISSLSISLAQQMSNTLDHLRVAQAGLAKAQEYQVGVNVHTGLATKQLTDAYRNQSAVVAGYQSELGTIAGYQHNYNQLLAAAHGNVGLLVAAGITSNQVIGATKSQMASLLIEVQAEVDQFKAMALGVGRTGAAMNALNYAGDTTNNMLGSMDVDMRKVIQGQDGLTGVILGGEQAFLAFNQAITGTSAKLATPPGLANAAKVAGASLDKLNAQSVNLANNFYNDAVPAAQQLIDSLEMQLIGTKQLTTVVADEAQQMLKYVGGNRTAEAVIISLINNAIGPGTVSFQNLNTWVKRNSGSQAGFMSIVAQSTVNAAKLGGTITQLTQTMFIQDLMLSAHVTPDLKRYTDAIASNGSQSDAAKSARAQLIQDYEKTGLSTQQATKLVNGLTEGLNNVPKNATTTLHIGGRGTIHLQAGGPSAADIILRRVDISAYAGGTKAGGAKKGWGVVGEKGPELVRFGGGEAVMPMYAHGTPGADLVWMADHAKIMAGQYDSAAANLYVRKIAGALAARTAATDGGYPAGPTGGAQYVLEKYAQSLFHQYAWPGWQILPLGALWTRESGWNRFARNRASGAYGIAQALPPTKYPFAGQAAGGSHADAQIAWGESYISGRYGTPARAWAHELAQGWYGGGADMIVRRPTLIGVGESGPERVTIGPASARRAGAHGPQKVVLEIRSTGSSDFDRFMTSWLCKAVSVKGAGSVQLAFGTGRG